MYMTLGMDRAACANFLQVSQQTLHNWETGRHVIPFAVYKLLRLMNYMELPGDTWAGWSFVCGKLISPEGHSFVGTDSSWWSLLVRRAAMFGPLYTRLTALEREKATLAKLERALAWAAAPALQRGPACGEPAAPVVPPALDAPPSNTGVNIADRHQGVSGGAK